MISKKTLYPMIGIVLILIISSSFAFVFYSKKERTIDHITIAILAKNKAHTLPLYLSCIEQQTWPKEKTYLYIRTNDNTDETADILKGWIDNVGSAYAGIHFDDTSISNELQKYKQHEWNTFRFKILGKIRQDSVDWAWAHNSHYFVVDCDNFIVPQTIEKAMEVNLPIVAPFLRTTNSNYSNYHTAINEKGYFQDTPHYYSLLNRELCGLFEQPVVHCTYFIRHHVLDQIAYVDDSERHEYVVFSDNARQKSIPQYLDNRQIYGRLTFAETKEEFEKEPWRMEFQIPTANPSASITENKLAIKEL